jgi:lysozyme
MKASINCIKLIEFFESLHDGDLKLIGLQPKMDPVGIWTEGWGHAIRDSKGSFIKGSSNKQLALKFSKIKTKEEADKQLLIDLEPREHLVMQNIKVNLNQNQFDSLISYVYNTGGSGTLYSLINKKASDSDIRKWIETHYITGQGSKKPLTGLVLRRKTEANLYFKK